MLLLVDASIPPRNIDLGCADWLFRHEVPFSLVFTKLDKRKKQCPPPEENIAAFEVRPRPPFRYPKLRRTFR